MGLPVYLGIIGNTGFPDQKLTSAIVESLRYNGKLEATMGEVKMGQGSLFYLPKSESKPDAMILVGVKPIGNTK
jgi:hypothetical protein